MERGEGSKVLAGAVADGVGGDRRAGEIGGEYGGGVRLITAIQPAGVAGEGGQKPVSTAMTTISTDAGAA